MFSLRYKGGFGIFRDKISYLKIFTRVRIEIKVLFLDENIKNSLPLYMFLAGN